MHRPRPDGDRDALTESAAARLLARASELDAAREAATPVEELRRAATEAGISPGAFDAALAEMQAGHVTQAPPAPRLPARRGPGKRTIAAIVGVLAVLAVPLGRMAVPPADEPAAPGQGVVETSILLRCLSPGQAAELVRPMLQRPANQVDIAPASAPGVLRIRATPEQTAAVQAALDRHERSAGAACAVDRSPGATP